MSGEPLRIVGPFHSMTGYSHMARAVLRLALVAGYTVEAVESDYGIRTIGMTDGSLRNEKYIPYYEEPDPRTPNAKGWTRIMDCQMADLTRAMQTQVPDHTPTILIQIPPNLGAWTKYGGSPLIGWTMTEADDLIPLWRHNMRCVDMLVAPSRYCLGTFKRAVPEVPASLLPIPVDDRLWKADEYRGEVPGAPPFLFLSAFTTSERKQWRLLMQAFAEEFGEEGDKVGLLLKPSRWPEVAQMATSCRNMGAWVYVDPEPCTDWVMGSLYRACSVYVQPSSEGFGLGPVEAGLCGKPSIALSLGGSADVVDEDCGYVCPASMGPVLGHAPDWFPRTFKFAVPDVDDMRRTLRRAYEQEVSGLNKGAKAQARMAQFTPEALAPAFREMVDEARAVHAQSKVYSVPPMKPRWATAAGAWGDVFCCAGNMKKVMAERGLEEIGVVYCGKDPKIADWLAEQDWCREVAFVGVPDKKALDTTFARLSQCRAIHGQAEFARLAAMAEVPDGPIRREEIAFTHLTMNQPQTPHYWTGARLAPSARLWAHEQAADIPGDFLLLNPLSIASNAMKDHWGYWNDAIEWLLAEAECSVVLVGEKPIDWPAHPRLVNLSGQSETMQDVLALAELSAGIVSTSNNLGIYAPIAGIESVIVCARTCGEDTFYHKWMETEPISLVEYGDSFGTFQAAVRGRFGNLLRRVPVRIEETDNAEREAATV